MANSKTKATVITMLIFKNKKAILLFWSCALPFILSAQPKIFAEQAKLEYPGENAVIVDWRQEINIENGSKHLSIHSENSCQIMHLSEVGSNDMIDKIPYDPNFYFVDDISACTWIPDGKNYKKLNVKEFKDMEDANGEHFYDGRRYKQIIYPNVHFGVVTEYNYTYNILDAHSLGAFYFDYAAPTLNAEFVVKAPKDVEIGIAQFGDKQNIQYTKTEKGSNIIHRWKRENSKKFKDFDYVVSDDHVRNHLFVYIKSYKQNNKEVVIQGTIDDLYKYNYSFIKDLAQPPSESIKQVVDSIKTNSKTQDDIAKGVYYWVQDNIRYIAFEDGLGGFIPREANLVFERKYGDCKDMASIIKTMMDYANVPCHLCWIGTRSKGYSYEELPLPYCDNHMIAAYNKNGEYIYMDATTKHQPFGYPSEAIQGKQTLIAIDADHYDAPYVPIVPCEVNYVYDTLKMTIQENNLHIKGHSIIGGYLKNQNTYNFISAGPQNEKKLVESLFGRGYNKCKIHDYKILNLQDRDKPLELFVDQTMQGYVRTSGNDIYINMNLDKSLLSTIPDTLDRNCNVDYDYNYYVDGIEELTLPQGYIASSVPTGIDIQRKDYDIIQSYKLESDKIIVHKIIKFKTLSLDKSNIPQLIKDFDNLGKAYQQVVVLTKK
jgi:hypothetical protein